MLTMLAHAPAQAWAPSRPLCADQSATPASATHSPACTSRAPAPGRHTTPRCVRPAQSSPGSRSVRAAAAAAAGEGTEENGAASKPAPMGQFRSSITLARLLEASASLGAPPRNDVDQRELGLGLRGLAPLAIGDKPACPRCSALGAVACATCETSGLYLDPVLESQGVMVKVRCLGCGGSGALMCPACGGRGFAQGEQ